MINLDSLHTIDKNRKVLLQGDSFAYVAPCEQLNPYISNFTITFPNETTMSDAYTVMPHGSVTLVVFEYQNQHHRFLFGPSTKPQKVGNIANKCSFIFIIEFQPAGFYPFINTSQKELTDTIQPLSYIEYALDQRISFIIEKAHSVEDLLQEMEKQWILMIRYPYPKELSFAISSIIQREGSLTSLEISNGAAYSQRQLSRLFNQYLGMSMKSFSRLVRVNKAMRLLNEEPLTLSEISRLLGYYDESHFVKDFKLVCQITPQLYKQQMSNFYNEIAKYSSYNVDSEREDVRI